MANPKLALLGAGQMATALAAGAVRSGAWPADSIWATDPSESSRRAFAAAIAGAHVADSPAETAAKATVLVIAVKPQHVAEALGGAVSALGPSTLVVSIAAGITLARLAQLTPAGTRIARVMPNTPCLVGKGASAFSLNALANQEDALAVRTLLASVGSVVELPEKLLDAVTGLSGSGPAFVYTFIEALADGGVQAGLPRASAIELAAQTVAGAAAMVLETGQHTAALRDAVASPAGTTIAGLAALEAGAFRAAVMGAVDAAAKRSAELGRSS